MMQRIQVEGVEKTIKNLNKYSKLIRLAATRDVLLISERVVTELQKMFPELKISGQFFEERIEYWISFQAEGQTLKWIKCPTSNLFYTRDRNPDGSQDFKSDVNELNPKRNNLTDTPKLANQIATQLANQIGKDIRRILK